MKAGVLSFERRHPEKRINGTSKLITDSPRCYLPRMPHSCPQCASSQLKHKGGEINKYLIHSGQFDHHRVMSLRRMKS